MTSVTVETAVRGTERVRHDTKARLLQVVRVRTLTPTLRRVTLSGEELQGFVSAAHDDHVKLFFPLPGAERPVLPVPGGPRGLRLPDGVPRQPARDYTPRRYDAVRNELDIDFALHGEGPAANWAARAQPGQWLGLAGPRGSLVLRGDFDWYLLAGDDTALPAIARRLEELPAGQRALVVAEVGGPADELRFDTQADVEVRWVHRGAGEPGRPELLLDAVAALELPAGTGYAWVAAESSVARAVRRHLLEQRGIERQWVKAAGYWRRGEAGAHETHIDE